MSGDTDPRLSELAMLILRLARGEYEARLSPTLQGDELDALAVGLNLLAETLEMERQAREVAQELLRDAVHAYEHAPAMFCSVDAESLAVAKCNATFAEALGLAKAELVGKCLLDLAADDDRTRLRDALFAIRDGEQPAASEFVLLASDGPPCVALMSASHVTEDGHAGRIRVILRDISLERSLAAQLRQAQKMEAVGRLASGVAHDFNNLLTVILGVAEQMQRKLGPDHPGTDDAALILDAGERAAGLTQQLLAFGRKAPALAQVHDVNALISESRAMLTRSLGEHVRIELALAPGPLLIRIDATQLTQILLNLALNARDAMPGGGVVTIRTADASRQAVITVTDAGSGMTPDVLEHAIEPFFTTKDVSRGSGLGLSVCYGIVQQAGGSFGLQSRVGEGTTVRVAFPLAERADLAPAPSAPLPGRASRGQRVLVVDDTDVVRRLLCRVLTGLGYEVLQAEDAASAHALLTESSTIDLLVTDVVMPETDGPKLARALWQRYPELPVLFVSGYTGDRLPPSMLEHPRVRFLEKPFRAQALEEAVVELLQLADAT